ncbi:hypothetical protein [Yinghuangia seranimata]|uniref:hypothetical protein n=1 Tax=Yinghuangia seranimata TaxID=408067 RepID=UPI00248C9B6D|nr:hypothetical protein [Yinghuangia seranimata]MDI2128174.1 hypothetical protein [Yinghuangia seranimata]
MNASYLLTPLLVFAVVGVLAVLLRWAFGRGHSLVSRVPRQGAPTDYGLLVAVASPADLGHGRLLCRRLTADGIRCTLVDTTEGLRLMVWPPDEQAARLALARDAE